MVCVYDLILVQIFDRKDLPFYQPTSFSDIHHVRDKGIANAKEKLWAAQSKATGVHNSHVDISCIVSGAVQQFDVITCAAGRRQHNPTTTYICLVRSWSDRYCFLPLFSAAVAGGSAIGFIVLQTQHHIITVMLVKKIR